MSRRDPRSIRRVARRRAEAVPADRVCDLRRVCAPYTLVTHNAPNMAPNATKVEAIAAERRACDSTWLRVFMRVPRQTTRHDTQPHLHRSGQCRAYTGTGCCEMRDDVQYIWLLSRKGPYVTHRPSVRVNGHIPCACDRHARTLRRCAQRLPAGRSCVGLSRRRTPSSLLPLSNKIFTRFSSKKTLHTRRSHHAHHFNRNVLP